MHSVKAVHSYNQPMSMQCCAGFTGKKENNFQKRATPVTKNEAEKQSGILVSSVACLIWVIYPHSNIHIFIIIRSVTICGISHDDISCQARYMRLG